MLSLLKSKDNTSPLFSGIVFFMQIVFLSIFSIFPIFTPSILNSLYVFRIRSNWLIQEIEEKYMSDTQYPITGTAELWEGMACLTVCSGAACNILL